MVVIAASPISASSLWAMQHAETVLAWAEAFCAREARSPAQRDLLATALIGLRRQADPQITETGGFPAIHLALLIHGALTGDAAPAVPLAGVTALVFLGADICDDLADGELSAHWADHDPAVVSLAATTLLAALPQLALSQLDAPPAIRDAMQATLARGLLAMSAGQERDLAMAGSAAPDPAAVEESVAGKSGGEMATFATLAAQLAGADAGMVARCGEIGRAIGIAGQLASDCHDLFDVPQSSDLVNGTRTLPIALHLARLDGAERARFLALLAAAKSDESARATVRRELRAAGALRRCAVIVEVYCQRARRLLAGDAWKEEGRRGLEALIDDLSFFPEGGSR